MSTGGSITTHKPRVYKPPQLPPTTDLNNKKKFAFLSTETVPDYRPIEFLDMSEKSQKTSSNQSTKFQQLQQKFGTAVLQVEPVLFSVFTLSRLGVILNESSACIPCRLEDISNILLAIQLAS